MVLSSRRCVRPSVGRNCHQAVTSAKFSYLYGEDLEAMMSAETVLHWDMRTRGHRLYLEPKARVAHTNFSLWSSWIPVMFLNGRVFAASRAHHMSLFKKIVFVVGSPLIPLTRLVRVAKANCSGELLRRFLKCSPILIFGFVIDAIGQMTGYAVGIGNSVHNLASFEFHRSSHITPADREEVFCSLRAN